MTDKQINKWLRRRFSPIGWVLLAYFAILFLLTNLAAVLDEAAFLLRGMVPDWDVMMGNGWGYILTILAGAVVLISWKGGEYWKNELFHQEKPISAGIFFAAAVLMVGCQLLNSLWITGLEAVLNQFDRSVMPYLEDISGSSDTFSMFLYASILAPVAEEVLFRGLVLRSLQPYGRRFAILGSAFLFGMYHGNLMQTPYAFLVGLIFGYVTVNYSLWWSVALHAFNNLVVADLLTRLLMLLPETAAGILDYGLLVGSTLAAAVILIVKRRDIRAWRQGEWMDRRVLKCFFTSPGILVFTVLMALMMLFML
ncbi:MAG: type II CAAX endopeptidase family protein [Eubacteriales bacterium]|nr:type II CAAX endopeptidase family protein [Eubacteriales bacterium]